jgi:hypothetical protein
MAGRSTQALELTGAFSRMTDKSQEIAELLTEIRDHLREGSKRQTETLEFLRAQAERSKVVVDHSVSLQELAIRRQRSLQVFAVPIVVMCIGVLVWLIFKY